MKFIMYSSISNTSLEKCLDFRRILMRASRIALVSIRVDIFFMLLEFHTYERIVEINHTIENRRDLSRSSDRSRIL